MAYAFNDNKSKATFKEELFYNASSKQIAAGAIGSVPLSSKYGTAYSKYLGIRGFWSDVQSTEIVGVKISNSGGNVSMTAYVKNSSASAVTLSANSIHVPALCFS